MEIKQLQIGNQEFFYITKGHSHGSLLDLVQDPDVRNESNLLYPINSEEADQVDGDESAAYQASPGITEDDSDGEDDAESDAFENLPYFHGAITREEAEEKLKGKPKGTFLTRFDR